MKRSFLLLAAVVAALALVATGCGGSEAVPDDAVAVVDGTEIPSSELDALMEQAKTRYEGDNIDFPRVGTPEYQSIQQQYVAFLVQKTQFEKAAEDMGIEVTDADVAKARSDLVKDRFEGDEKKLKAAMQDQGLDEEGLREVLRVSVLNDKLFKAVTKDVEVTDAEALQSYNQNSSEYGRPESREVRHILIAEKDSNGQVDYAKSKAEADRIFGELQGGGDFAALARQHTADTASKASGGKYTAVRGQSVPEFDKAAFALDTMEISRPVRTTYGYHIIQPLERATPAETTPFKQVKDEIKAGLRSTKQNEVMTKWVEDLQGQYEGKVTYAAGFAPPELPEETDTQTVTE